MIENLLFGSKKKELAVKRAQLLRRSAQVRHQVVEGVSGCAEPLGAVARVTEVAMWPLQMVVAHPKMAIAAAALVVVFKPARLIAAAGFVYSMVGTVQKLMAPALMFTRFLPKRGTK